MVVPQQYDPTTGSGIVIDDKTAFGFTGEHRIVVGIMSVTLNSGTLPTNLLLTSDMFIERYYALDQVTIPSISAASIGNNLQFNWKAIEGAEEYDLEYVYVNNYNGDVGSIPAAELPFDFVYNSTRVTVKGNRYTMPFIFDKGFVLYRVRAVGRHGANFTQRLTGLWSDPLNSGNLSQFGDKLSIISEHESGDMNWSYAAALNDEGKRSEAIFYKDGLFQNRQTVVRSQVNDQAIVKESYLDYNGRVAVRALSAPVAGNDMGYYPFFNLDDNPNDVGTTID
jgi:hypothetical protein